MESNIDLDMFNREAPLRDNMQKEIKRKRNKRRSAALKIIFAILIVLIILFVSAALYPSFSPTHSPEKLVAHYLNALDKQDWQKLYCDICTKNSEENNNFIEKEAFIDYCTRNPDAMNLTDSPIIDFEVEKDKTEDDLCYLTANYLSEDKSTGVIEFTVKKIYDGFWKFDKYAVLPFEQNIPSFSVYGVYGTNATLNGIELAPSSVSATDPATGKEYICGKYTAQYILPGTYELAATNENFENVNTRITVSTDGGNELYLEQTVSESFFSGLTQTAKDAVSKIYTGVINGSFDPSSLPLTESFVNGRLSDVTSAVSDDLYTSNKNYNITNFEITDAKPRNDLSGTSINLKNEIKIDFTLDFDYSYTAENPDYLGSNSSETKSNSGFCYFSFVMGDDGVWKINNMASRAWF